jgi:hypothetical protein
LSPSFSELQTELVSSGLADAADDDASFVDASVFNVVVDAAVDVDRFSSSRFRDVSFNMEAPAWCPDSKTFAPRHSHSGEVS